MARSQGLQRQQCQLLLLLCVSSVALLKPELHVQHTLTNAEAHQTMQVAKFASKGSGSGSGSG